MNRVTELATSVAQPLGLSVLDVRFSQQGRRVSLEVCIFREHGEPIGLADCEQVSRALDQAIEVETQNSGAVLPGSFLLEVVSPGIERQLTTKREFELFAGQLVKVVARENIGDLGSEFICLLRGGDDTHIEVSDAKAFEQKVSKGKAAAKKTAKRVSELPEALRYSSGMAFRLELARVFKINLYADDLKKERTRAN